MKIDLINNPEIKKLLDKFPRFSQEEKLISLKKAIVNKTYQKMLENESFSRVVGIQKAKGKYDEFEKIIKDQLNNSITINKVDYEAGFVEVINKKLSGEEERLTLDLTTLHG